jgi:subtilisin family serine protease
MHTRVFLALWLSLLVPTIVFARTPNDPKYDEQWYLETVSAPAAWDITTGSSEVVVAVLDSGMDLNHPDLEGNLRTNPGEVAGDGKDNDGNGFVDDVHGWDFVEDDNTATPTVDAGYSEDGVAHGSVIAGIIGAVSNNNKGVVGMSWNVKIMPVRILDNFGSGTASAARKAIRYAIDNGADIINLSFTGEDMDTLFEEAVKSAYEANIPVVAAVGNLNGGGLNLDETPLYPACFQEGDEDYVIGVGATDEDDKKAEFSNYGSSCTDIAAPGVDIYNLMYQNSAWDFPVYYDGGWSGTSVASPVVTGAIALLKSVYPTMTVDAIRSVLQLSVDPLQDATYRSSMGSGRLNIARAFEIAPAFASSVIQETQYGISPITGEIEEITPVSPGMYIRSASYETVYYVDTDNKRHPLWDEQTYFTWNDSWDEVTWVTDATLTTLTLGSLLPPKPGVVLVKLQSASAVYAVEEGGTRYAPVLRELSSERVAVSMFGSDWARYVIDIEPTLYTHYMLGEPMVATEAVDTSILKPQR